MPVNAFDNVAEAYDTSFTNTLVGKAQRNLVWRHLDNTVLSNSNQHILELNCGTGEDAVFFAKKGHNVIVTDASQEMLKVTLDKALQFGVKEQLTSEVFDMNKQNTHFKEGQFDLIFSNFGGINCVSPNQLQKLISLCHTWLKPNGRLVWVIMGKVCLWETTYFMLKGNLKQAFRRFTNEKVMANIGNAQIPIWYYSPKGMKEITARKFDLIHQQAIGTFVPPSYLEPFFSNKGAIVNAFEKGDQLFSTIGIFANISDHFLIDFKKKSV